MLKLLSEGFYKVLKSKLMWGMFIFGAVAGLAIAIIAKIGKAADPTGPVLMGGLGAPFVAAIFTSLHIGSEFSDGTIRNKLICGQGRIATYLSGLIVTAACVFGVLMIYFASASVFAVSIVGSFGSGMLFFKSIVLAVAETLCFTAIFTTVSYLVKSKAVSAVTCLVIAVVLMIVSLAVFMKLEESPTYLVPELDELGYMTGNFTEMANPRYITGAARQFLQFLSEFLPSGQLIAIMVGVASFSHAAAYATAITVVAIAIGVAVFRVINIK